MPYLDVNRTRRLPQNVTKLKYYSSAENVEAINNSIRNILMTKKGTLPGDPEFGSSIWNVVFEPIDGLTLKLIDSYVRECLAKYEPRVLVNNVDVQEVPEFHTLNILLDFEYLDKKTGETIEASTAIPISLK